MMLRWCWLLLFIAAWSPAGWAADGLAMTPLFAALKAGESARAEALITATPALVATASAEGWLPIHQAVLTADRACVTWLLDHGALTTSPGRDDVRPLHLAAYRGDVGIASVLLARGADVAAVARYSKITALHIAAARGQIVMMTTLLDGGAVVDIPTSSRNTPLMVAVAQGQTAAVEFLMKHGAGVNAATDSGFTALHYAAACGNLPLITYLLDEGANLEAGAPDATPLAWALDTIKRGYYGDRRGRVAGAHDVGGSGDLYLANRFKSLLPGAPVSVGQPDGDRPQAAALLIARGANIQATCRTGNMLQMACANGYTDIAQTLLDRGMDVKTCGLPMVAYHGHLALLGFLVARGADVNEQLAGLRTTPLHEAASSGRAEVIDFLLAHGATVDAVDQGKCTPLHYAMAAKQYAIAERLVAAGANPYLVTDGPPGRAPICDALEDGQRPLAQAMLARPGDPNVPGTQSTLLVIAARQGDLALVKAVLARGADATACGWGGGTPLYTAATAEIVQALVAAGADPNATIYDGVSPIFNASNVEVLRALLAAKANPMVVDKRGRTPLHTVSDADAFTLLLAQGIDAALADRENNTPLHVAARANRLDLVRMLLARRPPLNGKNIANETPASIAAVAGYLDVLAALLEAGADPDQAGLMACAGKDARNDSVALLLRSGAKANARTPYDVMRDTGGWTPLHCAAGGGAVANARLLLAAGADPTARDAGGSTPFFSAVLSGDAAVVDLLLATKPDLNARDAEGLTILARAVRGGNIDSARRILELGADANVRAADGMTPVHRIGKGAATELARVIGTPGGEPAAESIARVRGSALALATLLLEHGADVSLRDVAGQTPLAYAAGSWLPELVAMLLERGADAKNRAGTGATPLHQATGREIVQMLTRAGANVNARDDAGGTPLHTTNLPAVAEALLDAGADVAIADGKGNTALALATKDRNRRGIATLLAARGADVNVRDPEGDTALHRIAGQGALEQVAMLLAHGADPNAKDKNGGTPLSRTHRKEIAEALVNAGAHINATSEKGETPFMALLKHATPLDMPMVQFLLDNGADIHHADASGVTPLFLIAKHKSATYLEDTLAALLKRGVDLDRRDAKGETALGYAVRFGNTSAITALLAAGADPNIGPDDGDPPLVAATDGATVSSLLAKGAKAGARGRNRETVLYRAVARGDKATVELLLALPDDAAKEPDDGPLLMAKAVETGRTDLAEALLNAGVSPNIAGTATTPLHTAVQVGNVPLAALLLARGADPNALDAAGWTPLFAATKMQAPDIVAMLLKAGARAQVVGKDGTTPLNHAVDGGNMPIMLALLDGGGDVHQAVGKRPLLVLAGETGHMEIVRLLVEHGADVASADGDGRTVLHVVARSGDVATAEFLVAHGADVNARTHGMRRTPLAMARSFRRQDLITFLLAHGAKE